MSTLFGVGLVLVTVLLAVHSALGVMQYKHWLSIQDSHPSNENLPHDIVIECLIALLLVLIAIHFFLTNPMKVVINTQQKSLRTLDSVLYAEDFLTFRSRKHPISIISMEAEEKEQKQ